MLRVVTYPMLPRLSLFCGFACTALLSRYIPQVLSSQGQIVLRRDRASSSYLPIQNGPLLTRELRRHRASSSYPPFTSKPNRKPKFRRYSASSSYLPRIPVIRPIRQFRRHRASSSYSPSFAVDDFDSLFCRYRASSSYLPRDRFQKRLHALRRTALRA